MHLFEIIVLFWDNAGIRYVGQIHEPVTIKSTLRDPSDTNNMTVNFKNLYHRKNKLSNSTEDVKIKFMKMAMNF